MWASTKFVRPFSVPGRALKAPRALEQLVRFFESLGRRSLGGPDRGFRSPMLGNALNLVESQGISFLLGPGPWRSLTGHRLLEGREEPWRP